MRAIVYTSNTGSTEKYAKMLSHQICVFRHIAWRKQRQR